MKKVLFILLVLFAVVLTLGSCIMPTCKHDDPTQIVICEAKEPTCQEVGLTEGVKCNLCGVMVTPQVAIPELGCVAGEWVLDKEATKTENGSRHTDCTRCGERIDEVIYAGSTGFTYRVRSDGKSCEITGMGTCTDTEIVIPAYIDGYQVNLIRGGVFSYCTSIEVNEKNEFFKVIDGDLYTSDEKTLVQYITCKEDESFSIPSSVTTIGVAAFAHCNSLTSIVIPDSVENLNKYAFYGCALLESIVIPVGVTSIEEHAFHNCTSLESIIIPDSVTSIGDGAFDGCTSMKSITIPDSVTSIGNQAFSCCSALTSVTIPNSVTSIGSSVFSFCPLFTSIYFDGTVEQWNAITKDNVWDSNIGLYTVYCVDGEIAKQLKASEGLAYTVNDDNETCVITGIGTCTDSELIIPSYINGYRVTSIGSGAFYCCRSLESVVISDEVTSIEGLAFGECSALASIVIPNSVSSIGSGAFWGCSSLVNVIIPDSVVSIGSSAFVVCSSLESVIISKSVTSIECSVFEGCASLASVVIPDGVTSICDSAFDCCYSLTSVNLPASVTSIGYYAFYKCESLTSINFNGTVEQWNAITKGAYWKDNRTFDIICTNSEITYLPESEGLAYSVNSDKRSCTITGIGTCTNNEIRIPEYIDGYKVTDIGSYAFNGCTSIKRVTISGGVTTIGYTAFGGCTSLVSVEIPDSITCIDWNAFYSTSLIDVYYAGDVSEWLGISFNRPDAYIRVFTGVNLFFNGELVTEIEIPDTITSIPVGAFAGCASLKSVIIHDRVTSIGANAFAGTSLEKVDIPNSVTRIGGYAFSDCTSLVSIEIPYSMTIIDENAFSDCTSLVKIIIPDSVTTIGYGAFDGCTALTIYCQTESEPSGWYVFWNPSDRPVVWGYNGK